MLSFHDNGIQLHIHVFRCHEKEAYLCQNRFESKTILNTVLVLNFGIYW